MTLSVGFVGLGNIGRPMALRLASAPAEAGLALTVYDVVPEPLQDGHDRLAGVRKEGVVVAGDEEGDQHPGFESISNSQLPTPKSIRVERL